MDILQLKDSEVGDVTEKQGVISSIMSSQFDRDRRSENRELSNYQWLKHLGFGFDISEDTIPAVFRWIVHARTCSIAQDTADRSPKVLRYTLRTLLSLGADICARWLQLSPLQYSFHIAVLEEDRLLRVKLATALLENEADLFALDDNGESVFDFAEQSGLTSDLFVAVQRVGYDLDEVIDKIDHLQWVFHNPNCGIAESTAIDNAQVAPSFTTELTSRRAIVSDRLED